jgi:hypothetical protein
VRREAAEELKGIGEEKESTWFGRALRQEVPKIGRAARNRKPTREPESEERKEANGIKDRPGLEARCARRYPKSAGQKEGVAGQQKERHETSPWEGQR